MAYELAGVLIERVAPLCEPWRQIEAGETEGVDLATLVQRRKAWCRCVDLAPWLEAAIRR